MIQLSLRHLTSAEVEEVWHDVQTPDGSDLADNLAVTIASWWQSPGTVGRHLAALASGAPVSAEDLAADIEATIREHGTYKHSGRPATGFDPDGDDEDLAQLRWLASWVEDWSSR